MGDEALAEAAEAVRAYLVSARGGAPLLSGADARQLRDWLVAGVRIGAIVRAIDVMQARRVARRARTALSLTACRGEVEKQQKRAGAWVRAGGVSRVAPAAPADDARFARVDGLAREAVADIAALAGVDAEARARRACARAARFFEDAWDAAPRESLLEEADAALAGSRSLYADAEWEEMRESVAREGLRRRYPHLTATHLWEESRLGLE